MSRRGYDNSLRTEQAEQTKQRILEAAVALASEKTDVSTAAIAQAAGVSEPTVYRHFPNREALFTALSEYAEIKLGAPPIPQTAEELPTSAIAMATYLGRNRTWIRAGMRHPEYRELRMAGRRKRLAALRKLLADRIDHLEDGERDLAFAAIACTMRGESWDYLTTEHDLSDEEAGRAMAFMLDACLEKLAKLARGRKTTIVDDAMVERARELEAAASKKGQK